MSDSEIQILIKAQDEATQVLKNIQGQLGNVEKQVTSTAKSSQAANRSLSQSFSAVQGAMLNLGQVAQGVHQIFETVENQTRRLENAQDRLENATIRLKQAQSDLVNIERSHEKNLLNVEKATINNRRAQEELKVFTDKLAQGVKFTGERLKEYEDAQIRAKEAGIDLADAQNVLSDEASKLKDAQDAVTIANNKVDVSQRALNKVINDGKWMYVNLGVQVLSVVGNAALLTTTLIKEWPAIVATTSAWWLKATALWANVTAMLAFEIAGAPVWAIILAIIAAVGIAILIWKNWAVIWGTLVDWIKVAWEWMQKFWYLIALIIPPIGIAIGLFKNWGLVTETLANWFSTAWDVLKGFADWIEKTFFAIIDKVVSTVSKAIDAVKSFFSSSSGKVSVTTNAVSKASTAVSSSVKKKDFLMRPGQQAVNFSPDDTIIGMKNPNKLISSQDEIIKNITNQVEVSISSDILRGIKSREINETNVYITGDNYGTDPKQIADEIMKNLRRKISI